MALLKLTRDSRAKTSFFVKEFQVDVMQLSEQMTSAYNPLKIIHEQLYNSDHEWYRSEQKQIYPSGVIYCGIFPHLLWNIFTFTVEYFPAYDDVSSQQPSFNRKQIYISQFFENM